MKNPKREIIRKIIVPEAKKHGFSYSCTGKMPLVTCFALGKIIASQNWKKNIRIFCLTMKEKNTIYLKGGRFIESFDLLQA